MKMHCCIELNGLLNLTLTGGKILEHDDDRPLLVLGYIELQFWGDMECFRLRESRWYL